MQVLDIIRGLVRPFIAVSFVSVTLYLAIVGKLEAREVLAITGIIAAFYFGERAGRKKRAEESNS
jgi:hypothetical protein